jgi:carboxyl-terminal processing protease
MRYNDLMQWFAKFKKYLPYVWGVAAVLLMCGTGLVAYRLGYARGAGDISQPLTSQIVNPHSTGEITLDDPGASTDFGKFWQVWNLLDKNFVPSSNTVSATTSSDAKVVGAIEGMVASYGDPYTVFIPKEQAASFKEQVNGEFEGIGAALNTIDGALTIVGIVPKSPAEHAGLAAGDRILAVDGILTDGQDVNDAVSHIRGPAGTKVTLAILHAGAKKQTDIAVTRGNVVLPTTATKVVTAAKSVIAAVAAKASTAAGSVAGALGIGEKKEEQAAKQQFFVLQLATFAKSSTDAFVSDLGHFAKSDTPYLIIDLRNNPGGYIDTAVDLASYFLPKGALVVTEKTGAANVPTEHVSLGYPLLGSVASSSKRIVVLVNRNSASASEILAGALQDHGIAKVVGEQSFGKGSAQTLVDIGDIGSLKITVARWYTPSGRNISHEGITPDIKVDANDPSFASSTDPYMDAATEALLDDSLWKK